MLNPECVNPKDVMMHLNSLGYHDISPKQLKEFIHDLKKLIKYDQKQALQYCGRQEPANPPPSECSCSYSDYDACSGKFSSSESYCESSASNSTATYSRNTKFNESNKHSARNTIESDLTQRAHTSFIRAWNLQGCKDPCAKRKKNPDPVRLYHQYKECWKNQHFPGEYKHLELRWVVRNKMVGQEPNPRVSDLEELKLGIPEMF